MKRYQKELDKEIDEDRTDHRKKPFEREETTKKKKDNTSKKKLARRKKEAKKKKIITQSAKAPECGMFHKGEHEK